MAAATVVAMIHAGCAGEGPELRQTTEPTFPAPTTSISSISPGTTQPPRQTGTVVARARHDQLVAYATPDTAAAQVSVLTNPTTSGGALVVRVLTPPDQAGNEWLEAMLPVRPNGTTGWIQREDVELSVNPYRIEIDTSDYRLDLYEQDELTLSTSIAVGTGDTPTPYGEFYLAELLEPPDPDGAYGPFAFGLSGFSEVVESFAGGNGVIGIHGTNDPGAVGTDVSHGCVRVVNDVIEQLAARVPLGTPVIITV